MRIVQTVKRRAVAALIGGGLIATVASGCFAGTEASSTGADCGTSDDTPRPVVAMLVQEGAGGQITPDDRTTVDRVVEAAASIQARLLLAGTGPTAAREGVAVDTTLVGEGPNDLLREQNLSCREDQVRDGYQRLATHARESDVRLVTALRGIAASMPRNTDTIDVVVLGSAVNATRPDLGDPRYLDHPARSINGLARNGLNFRCDGWRVHMVGAGREGARRLDDATDSRLRSWWRKYLDHCGGTLVYYAPTLTEFPAEGEVSAPDRSLIPLPIEHGDGEAEATLSSDVVFAHGSAKLTPAASALLRRLLAALASSRERIEVIGHTDSTGPASVNMPLSRRRAEVVAGWLESHSDIPPGRFVISGRGETNPVATNGTPKGRARNRRVVVRWKTD